MSTVTEQTVYRPLAESFKSDGFTFQLVARQGDIVLFAKIQPHHKAPSYEVVIVQKHEAHTWPDGKTSPAREAMPNSEAWGKQAWTPGNWRQAIHMFKAHLWDQGLHNQPVTWLWPDNLYSPPEKEWVLGRAFWEEKHGPPAGWLTAQEVVA
jgi:hypothetical protein